MTLDEVQMHESTLIGSYPAAHGEHQQRQEPDGERVAAALAAAAAGLRGGGARARPRDRAAAGGLRAVDAGEGGAAPLQDQGVSGQGQRLAAGEAGEKIFILVYFRAQQCKFTKRILRMCSSYL